LNGFDLRAIGWVVTRDTFADLVRAALGARGVLDPEALRANATRWSALETAYYAERGGSLPALLTPSAASLPRASAAALTEFVRQLVADAPERYAPAALRSRFRQRFAQALIGFGAGALLCAGGAEAHSLLADAGLAMLVMGVWSIVTAVQLWRAFRVVDEIVHHAEPSQPPVSAQSARERSHHP
jgi:hypothetical protein